MHKTSQARAALGSVSAFVVVGMVVLAGCASGVAAPAAPNAATPTAGAAGPHSGAHKRGKANADGVFFVDCTYSHTANDDPIVMPGMTQMSMLHDFFGNITTDATSTPASLSGGPTSCGTAADASAYWTPVLYANGQALRPSETATYWHPASATGPTPDLPANLEMIAGDEHASAPQSLSHIAWVCHDDTGRKGNRTRGPKTPTPHVCGAGQHIKEEITFPNCWDGTTSTTAITPDHVVYASASGACPKADPTALLVLRMNVMYPNPTSTGAGTSPATFTLSTGPGQQGPPESAHADFMDGWNTSAINRLVSTCLDAHVKCAKVSGNSATPHGLGK